MLSCLYSNDQGRSQRRTQRTTTARNGTSTFISMQHGWQRASEGSSGLHSIKDCSSVRSIVLQLDGLGAVSRSDFSASYHCPAVRPTRDESVSRPAALVHRMSQKQDHCASWPHSDSRSQLSEFYEGTVPAMGRTGTYASDPAEPRRKKWTACSF